MSRIIQMVKTSDEHSVFICGFDAESNELTFRSSRNPQNLQTEKVTIDNNMVYSNLYFFHVGYLQKFVNANE